MASVPSVTLVPMVSVSISTLSLLSQTGLEFGRCPLKYYQENIQVVMMYVLTSAKTEATSDSI